MSHIPNSAMPHAGPQTENASEDVSESRLGRLAQLARENPKTMAAAGAAVVAGVAAAAATAIRSRGQSGK